MHIAGERRSHEHQGSVLVEIVVSALMFIWWLVRIPISIVLSFLEPFVRISLSAIAVLSVMTGLVYKGSSVAPPIPFWMMICVALACLTLVPIYQGLLRLLSR